MSEGEYERQFVEVYGPTGGEWIAVRWGEPNPGYGVVSAKLFPNLTIGDIIAPCRPGTPIRPDKLIRDALGEIL